MYKFLLLLIIFIACPFVSIVPMKNTGSNKIISVKKSDAEPPKIVDMIIKYGETFIGKPYKYNIKNYGALDCSRFVAYAFQKYGYRIPHSPGAIFSACDKISLSQVRKGDLLFFEGRRLGSSRIGHVSMVVEVGDNSIKMLHSSSRGILIDELLNKEYYQKRLLKVGRYNFEKTEPGELEKENSPDIISVNAVGDMMLGSNYPDSNLLPPNDGENIFKDTKKILEDADITIGNLEGGLMTAQVAAAKKSNNPDNCYFFKMPEHYVNYFKAAGFDVLNIGNNHIGDFGEAGIKNTIKVLDNANIKYAGLKRAPYTIYEVNKIKIGFCGFAPNSGCMDAKDYESAGNIVRFLDSTCNIVIVSMHIGAEGKEHRHITRENEMFLNENRGNPYKFARAVIDAGADLVIGHGPHVVRAVDIYKNKFIAYSLGNFFTFGRFNIKEYLGRGLIANVFLDKTGNFLKAKIISTKQSREGVLSLDPKNGALQDIIDLTKADILNSELLISEDGWVTKTE